MKIFDSLDSCIQQKIEEHLKLVIEENERVNLTRITDMKEAMVLHVEDSLTALKEVNEAPDGLYGDLGSGGGYPGIPLALATGRNTVLIDSRAKKMEAMEKVISKLDLTDKVRTFPGRAELLAIRKPESFAVLTARALSNLSVLMELASPLLFKGGHLVCYKAQLSSDEKENALSIQKLTGMKLLSERQFELEQEYSRTILVFEKSGKPQMKLPRKEGEAQKYPLS